MTDVAIFVQGSHNTAETGDVAPEKAAASSRAGQPVLDARFESARWVITQHPTAADAQAAGMSTEAGPAPSTTPWTATGTPSASDSAGWSTGSTRPRRSES